MHTVIARWYVVDGKLAAAVKALAALAAEVEKAEPDTWGYLVHSGGDQSLPPVSENEIVFVETYKDEKAFMAHVNGPTFQGFVAKYKDLFVLDPQGQPFYEVTHVVRIAGFVRPPAC
jgi:quinol monooxygenase YgiN